MPKIEHIRNYRLFAEYPDRSPSAFSKQFSYQKKSELDQHIMEMAYSVKNVPIRLTYERWYHIVENHDDLASYFHEVLDTVENPEFIMQGNRGTLKAAKNMGKKKWLVVIYKELSREDGFIITSYFLPDKPKGNIIWKR